MKKLMMMLGATYAWLGLIAAPLSAQDTGESDVPGQAAIPAALSGVKYVTKARPRENVEVYYLLSSHSRCGICVSIAPEFVKLHKKMRGKGAELILLSGDPNDEMALNWANSVKMTYPVVSPADARKVPFRFDYGGGSVTLPCIVAVSPDGEKLGQANGPNAVEFVADWKKLVREQKKKSKATAAVDSEDDGDDSADAEESEPTISHMLKTVKYATKVRPKKKASVYFFIRSHSGCGPCKALVPKCVDLYKEMKGKGAEMIMLNSDKDEAAAAEWAESAKMTYPVITPETAGNVDVPSGGSGTPNVVAVTDSGEMLETAIGASDCAELMGRWKELVKDIKKKEQKEKKKNSDQKKKKSKKGKKSADSDDEEEV